MLAVAILILGILSRFIFHVPNFTPVVAIALFSGAYVNRKFAFILPLGLMLVTDLVIGLHSAVVFTWGSMLLIPVIGLYIRKKRGLLSVLSASIGSAVLFFMITNFGVWLTTGLYARNMAGLIQCYQLAIPFFRVTLLSTLVYSSIFYAAYELIAVRVKNTQLAFVLS